MRYAIKMWSNTRMIVLVAVSAAIYAAALIAFKTAIPLIPGVTEVRVAGIFLMTFGILFGPAGAWGLAIGNLIGDIFGGTLGPASIAGFFGNFLLGYLPYTMWLNFFPFSEKSYEWNVKNPKSWSAYISITIISSCSCAVLIGLAVDILGIVPYEVVSRIIALNNIVGNLIGVVLLIAVYELTKNQLGLLWTDIMGIRQDGLSMRGIMGSWLVAIGSIAGMLAGFIPGLSVNLVSWSSVIFIVVGSLIL
ncbi:MAG TPA: QueT transporter family protein [Syntrophorhabdaceae bacterium]|nr:QueT transporter family protein [Syntrophorhabdaceae bacterium]HOL06337.1 QueT transporter family protein [Syntrophorhabdaceae bacterium]HON85863.1 QueT transporter family protein [Syntrophorhabdaceae bacterium]HOT41778.1 QueT transporter family protein [Syntrophorhabdaceae bacterium]HPC67268.1 QueT transporter family protein [Syntrophorhabdaceae bacterium]